MNTEDVMVLYTDGITEAEIYWRV
ncbi:MAG TPA: hypothetical protein DD761_01160 [Cyanobacteria bacterium UBA11691]|nr:hypothetical protein [Cyanobacteria bacterium UBA11691]